MRRRVHAAVLSIAIVCGCSTHQPPKQTPAGDGCTLPQETGRSIVTTSHPAEGDSVARGQLAGTVVDAETGKPLQARIDIPASNRGTLSDSTGHFRIAVPRADARVFVQRIGYVRAEIPTNGVAESGLVASVRLHLAVVGLCHVKVTSAN